MTHTPKDFGVHKDEHNTRKSRLKLFWGIQMSNKINTIFP